MPGDVVLVEAGNRVPADGRICVAATLEIEEAALTGESLPVGKSIDPVPGDDVPLGDRICMAFMNTAVTRGRGELIVTGTGMDTEIGHIADLLTNTETDKTPLQKQLDGLTKIIAVIAGIALVLVDPARAAARRVLRHALHHRRRPGGLRHPDRPAGGRHHALSMGTRVLASRHAIVKRLPAVETLGSTSAICSDKTGTLTLNKMTARELVDPGPEPVHHHRRGLRHHRRDQARRRRSTIDLDPYLLPMVLCADAVLDGEALIGDPTEGALIVLGAKGGLDIDETRRGFPADRGGAVRLRVQVHGDVPRDDRDAGSRSCGAS